MATARSAEEIFHNYLTGVWDRVTMRENLVLWRKEMKVDVKPLNPVLLVQSRGGEVAELRAALDEIEQTEEFFNKLLTIAVYSLPDEAGKAHAHKQSLSNAYGKSPEVAGWRFSVARAPDNSEEYLAAQYMPEEILEGAWDEFQTEKRQAAKEAKERAEARRIERELEAATQQEAIPAA